MGKKLFSYIIRMKLATNQDILKQLINNCLLIVIMKTIISNTKVLILLKIKKMWKIINKEKMESRKNILIGHTF